MKAVARGFRPEIQGLRAVAVVAVLLFHVWPHSLPGGYVGVDVFFVISGYLITGLLLRDAEANGRVSLAAFYVRRIRRLLPAATLVLVAVAACVSVLPLVRWEGTAQEIIASALYVENWWLAAKAVDYLGAEEAPSALQHYWSLSIEEQYYILWPLLLALLSVIARRVHERPRLAFGLIVCILGLASLAYSIYLTPRNGATAYFASTTRIWELAMGSALAVFTAGSRLRPVARDLLGTSGVALIIVSMFAYSAATPFPGYHALMPTVGAAMVIHAGAATTRWSPTSLLSSRVAQYLGDISYSLYLWHWPAIVFYSELSGSDIGLVDGLIISVVSIALAHQTKDLVEDRFRFGRAGKGVVLVGGALSIGLALACAVVVSNQFERRAAMAEAAQPGSGDTSPALTPSPARARSDQPMVNKKKCHVDQLTDTALGCDLGDKVAGRAAIVLVGDSHAAQWTTTLEHLARVHDWRVVSFTKSACAFADVEIMNLNTRARDDSCIAWNANVLGKIREIQPRLVLVSQSRRHAVIDVSREQSPPLVAAGLLRRWRELRSSGVPVVAIEDTPWMRTDVPDCMSRPDATIDSCSTPLAEATKSPDPIALARKQAQGVGFIDMSEVLCPDGVCIAAKDGILRWRDRHHMTATYAATLSDELYERLQVASAQAGADL